VHGARGAARFRLSTVPACRGALHPRCLEDARGHSTRVFRNRAEGGVDRGGEHEPEPGEEDPGDGSPVAACRGRARAEREPGRQEREAGSDHESGAGALRSGVGEQPASEQPGDQRQQPDPAPSPEGAKVRTDKPRVEVSWQVTARRNDAYLGAHPFHDIQNKKP
jgi:hypothetical protein